MAAESFVLHGKLTSLEDVPAFQVASRHNTPIPHPLASLLWARRGAGGMPRPGVMPTNQGYGTLGAGTPGWLSGVSGRFWCARALALASSSRTTSC